MTDEKGTDLLALIPEPLAGTIAQRARLQSKDVGTVVFELLREGLTVEAARKTDLHEFIDSWEDDPEFDKAVAAFETIDENLWQ